MVWATRSAWCRCLPISSTTRPSTRRKAAICASRSRCGRGACRIAVSDNGIGMAPGLVARAFDLFAQAERSVDRSSGGLGLGLALVKSLVELHGGTVSCESPGPGKGSRFTVCLPRLAEPKEAGHQQAEAPPAHRARTERADPGGRRQRGRGRHAGHAAGGIRPRGAGRARLAPGAGARRRGVRRRSACSISACPTWTAPSWRAACAPSRKPPRPAGRGDRLRPGQRPRRTGEAGFDHHLVKPIDLEKLQALLG
jgi:hypothetical protein